MKILTETQRVPNGVAHAPRGRYDVQQRGIVARRFPLHQHHNQTRMERESDHWKKPERRVHIIRTAAFPELCGRE